MRSTTIKATLGQASNIHSRRSSWGNLVQISEDLLTQVQVGTKPTSIELQMFLKLRRAHVDQGGHLHCITHLVGPRPRLIVHNLVLPTHNLTGQLVDGHMSCWIGDLDQCCPLPSNGHWVESHLQETKSFCSIGPLGLPHQASSFSTNICCQHCMNITLSILYQQWINVWKLRLQNCRIQW